VRDAPGKASRQLCSPRCCDANAVRSASVDRREGVAACERRPSEKTETGVLSAEMQCVCADIIVVRSEMSAAASESAVVGCAEEHLEMSGLEESTFEEVSRIG
jgi:hypothetical protein